MTDAPRRSIAVLPEVLANQIAAGEVVERPASVVKELVENALDAEASRVFVDIGDGGRSLIRVVDDGVGMTRADATLAVRRHATSKIRSSDDLQAIETLGFRGEALPSIASVSRFKLVTRTADAISGTQVSIEGGSEPLVSDAGTGVGTRIEVRDLFFNVPARLKFLKRRATEAGHINTLMTAFALGHPHVHFKVSADGRTTSEHPAATRLDQRIFAVMGRGTAARLHEVRHEGAVRIRGYISEPGHTRTNQAGIHTFVNGRRVRDRTVNHALVSAYGTLIERGRFPYAVLYVHVEPDAVDVNVHPTKAEVRFTRAGQVHDAIVRACKLTLVAAPWRHLKGLAPPVVAETRRSYNPGWRPLPARRDVEARVERSQELRFPTGEAGEPDATRVSEPSTGARVATKGLVRERYLIVEDEVGIRIIDVGAASRRLTELDLQAAIRTGEAADSKPMLIPVQVEFDAAACSALTHQRSLTRSLGFELEPFGGSTWQLLAVAAPFASADHLALVRTLASHLRQSPQAALTAAQRDRLVSALARHLPVPATEQARTDVLQRLREAGVGLDDLAVTVSFDALQRRFHEG